MSEFCKRFRVAPSAAPNLVVQRRVMRAVAELELSVDCERASARAWYEWGVRQRVWSRVAWCVALAAIAFALLMLNALPSAQAAPRGAVDVRGERLLRQWCPSSMSRRNCLGWMRVAQCETGGQQWSVTYRSLQQIRWRYNGSSGYDGALQFSPRTWRASVGRIPARRLTRAQYVARARGAYWWAYDAPPVVQVLASDALRVRPDGGLGQWPSCGGRWR